MKKIEMEVICEDGGESYIRDSMEESAKDNGGFIVKVAVTDCEVVPKGNMMPPGGN